MEHKLIVEKVEGPTAVFVYRAGERARAERVPSGAMRYNGAIVDRVLHGKLSNGAQLTYTLSADEKTLNGHYARNGKGWKGVFERQ